MAAPELYANSLPAIEKALGGVRRGTVTEFGRSAGGRPLWSVAYGEFEPIARTANLSASLAAGKPEAFFGAERRAKQVMLITSAIHGGEMESIAAVLNLIAVLEAGTDLKGQQWPDLTAAAEQLRLVIVPCLNPDGRARVPSDDPTVWSEAEQEKYRHGLHADGSNITWPACKTPHPRDPKADGFLGSYFNDAGVNPLHGVFLSPEIAPETHAAMALALAETPDLLLDLHSCGVGPFFIVGDRSLPESYSRRCHYFDGFLRRSLRDRLDIHRNWTTLGFEGTLTFPTACHHLAGVLPIIFEGPHGAQEGFRYTHAQIVDMYLVMLESLMIAGVRERFKPEPGW
jgi:hypothetical protein